MLLCCSILAPRQGLRQGVYVAGQKLSTHSVMELLRGSCPPGEEPPSDAELALFANTIVGRQVACLQRPDCHATQPAELHAPPESAGPLFVSLGYAIARGICRLVSLPVITSCA